MPSDTAEESVPNHICIEDLPDGLLQDEGLIEIREKWEEGLEPTTIFIPFRATDEPNMLCVVLEDVSARPELQFHCHRYMRALDGSWDVSVDGQGVSYREALGWIPSPRAL